MIHDYIVIQPLPEIPTDSEGEFVESNVLMDDSDEVNDHERMEKLIVPS